MILFSDLHLRPESADIVFGEVLPGILEAAIGQDDRHVIFLGDFYHLRYNVPVDLQNRVHETWKAWKEAGITLDLLPGNHDQIDLAGRHALEVFSTHPNVTVWTEPGWGQHGFYMPYRKDEEVVRQTVEYTAAGEGSPAVLFYHGGIRGAAMNDHREADEGIRVDDLKGWKKVFCGHYHKRQKMLRGKIVYVGSPWQTRADEAGHPKGYATWNGSKFAWVDTQWGPRYHKIEVPESGNVPDLSDIRPGDIVRASVADSAASEAVVRLMSEHGVTDVTVTVAETEAPTVRLEVEDGAPIEAFAQGYVDLQRGDLDAVKLMEMFAEVSR